MAKKDKDDTGDNQGLELDKEQRKRLEKHSEDWDVPNKWSNEKLTAFDLRLLLVHHAPLQALIRHIATQPAGAPPLAAAATAEATIASLKAELAQCTATSGSLLQDKRDLQHTCRQLEQQLQQAKKEQAASEARLAQASREQIREIKLLREDDALARRLDLVDLPADQQQALIQVVAVLAQRDNLERLWTTIKERCEAENRTVSSDERQLIETALDWHNHNWRSRPFQLIDPQPGASYDYSQQLRSHHTPAGEQVSATRLPGIADGGGKALPMCKALVCTR